MVIIYLLFLCFFLLFLISFIINIKIRKYEGRTEAEIVSIEESCRNGRNRKIYTYYPTYKYEVNGITYQKEFPFGEVTPSTIFIGKKVVIKYDKKEPEKFIVTGKEYVWLGQAIFGLVMSIIILAVIIAKHLGL